MLFFLSIYQRGMGKSIRIPQKNIMQYNIFSIDNNKKMFLEQQISILE